MVTGFQSDRTAVILAGGEGTRLHALTRQIFGQEMPKQFCRGFGKGTLLEQTWRRVNLLIEPARTVTVLTREHAHFYEPLRARLTEEQVAVQPLNRGTAPAILYALMRLKQIAPDSTVGIFPSDHFVSDDQEFMRNIEIAFRAVDARPEATVLIGTDPTDPEAAYSWIEPGKFLANESEPVRHVQRVWENPSRELAQKLLRMGCLWNTSVVVARLTTFLGLFLIALPDLHNAFDAIKLAIGALSEEARVKQLYNRIAPSNFASEVLARSPVNLAVLRLRNVQVTDLDDSRRVMSLLADRAVRSRRDRAEIVSRASLTHLRAADSFEVAQVSSLTKPDVSARSSAATTSETFRGSRSLPTQGKVQRGGSMAS